MAKKKKVVEEIEIEELDEEELAEIEEAIEDEDEDEEELEEEELEEDELYGIEERLEELKKEFKEIELEKLNEELINNDPSTNPVFFFSNISDMDNDYYNNYKYKKNIEKELETSLIKEKLNNFDDNNLFEIANDHLEKIRSMEYFYNIIAQVEGSINEDVWDINKEGDVKDFNIDLNFIREIVRIFLNKIKEYWKKYDEEQEKLKKQRLEKIDKLTPTQLLRLCLNLLKATFINIKSKPDNAFLLDLMTENNLFFKVNTKQ